ncbi:LysE family translocator [Phaeovulum sp. W22_SRMD_FR3]|uniref:LysE family translocator n=1 Tax=Phaeovulum sp. W22_SRMD_FR3 TaxID=3240274 RepID=UPI003F94A8B1
MSHEILFALAAFAFVSSITPGPNNLMLMTSGANFGLRRTVPHSLGVALGFCLMIFLLGLGAARLFQTVPQAWTVLKVLSILYMVWLAWKMLHAAAPGSVASARAKPFTFVQAAAFQWVNPKAWAMALTAISAYLPLPGVLGVLVMVVIFGVINLLSVNVWVVMGMGMARFLADPRRLRIFNGVMAVLLLASLAPVLLGGAPAP